MVTQGSTYLSKSLNERHNEPVEILLSEREGTFYSIFFNHIGVFFPHVTELMLHRTELTEIIERHGYIRDDLCSYLAVLNDENDEMLAITQDRPAEIHGKEVECDIMYFEEEAKDFVSEVFEFITKLNLVELIEKYQNNLKSRA